MVSKAQQKATTKYQKKKYDRLNILVPKGQRENIKDYAQKNGESLNSFVNRAINLAMKEDNTNQEI